MEGRETRFTAEVLAEACVRLNVAKEELHCSLGTVPAAGDALFERLGWAPLTMGDLADPGRVAALIREQIVDDDEAHEAELMVALWDGLMLGAIAADITWERSMGLGVAS